MMTLASLFSTISRPIPFRIILSPITGRSSLRHHAHIHNYCQWTRNCSSTSNGRWVFSGLNLHGKVVVRRRSPRPIAFRLAPLSPQDYPGQDQAIISLSGLDLGDSKSGARGLVSCSSEDGIVYVTDLSPEVEQVFESRQPVKSDLECKIEVPLKYDCDIALEGYNNVSLSDFENQDIDLQVQHGECNLRNIKSSNIQIRSDSGAISSDSLLQGNVFIQSETGSIKLHKPVSQSLTIQTNEADVHIQNLYAEKSSIITHHSNVHIGTSHRHAQVDISYHGNLTVGSVDGTFRANVKSGNVDVLVSQHEWLNISTGQGDVLVKISDERNTTLDLRGDEVIVDKKLVISDKTEATSDNEQTLVTGRLGEPEDIDSLMPDVGLVRVCTGRGRVDVKCQDWLSSLNLGTIK